MKKHGLDVLMSAGQHLNQCLIPHGMSADGVHVGSVTVEPATKQMSTSARSTCHACHAFLWMSARMRFPLTAHFGTHTHPRVVRAYTLTHGMRQHEAKRRAGAQVTMVPVASPLVDFWTTRRTSAAVRRLASSRFVVRHVAAISMNG